MGDEAPSRRWFGDNRFHFAATPQRLQEHVNQLIIDLNQVGFELKLISNLYVISKFLLFKAAGHHPEIVQQLNHRLLRLQQLIQTPTANNPNSQNVPAPAQLMAGPSNVAQDVGVNMLNRRQSSQEFVVNMEFSPFENNAAPEEVEGTE